MLSWRKVLGKKRTQTPQALEVESDIALGFALEARMLFDGAVVATVDQAASTQQADSSTAASASSDAAADSSAADASQDQATSGTDSQNSDSQNTADDLAVASDPVRKEVVFIDTSVANYQSLVNGVKSGVEVVLLDASQDGLSQIAVWAQTHSGYDAIHIISNGDEGSLSLGNITLDNSSLSSRSADLAVIGSALTDSGDILLYGCDVAQGSDGLAFISELAALTSADVAASDDLTGAASLNGDWTLEAQVGDIESSSVLTETAQNSYTYVLDTFTFTSGTETGSGSNSVTWTEGGHTLNFDFVGIVSSYFSEADGFYIIQTDGGGTSNSLTFTITVADGYIFDLSSLDLINADSEWDQNYTISSNLSNASGEKSGTLAKQDGSYTSTTISGFDSTFTGVSSITITTTNTNQYYLDNLVLNNIRLAATSDATSTVTAGPATEAAIFATTSTSVATATSLLDFTITDNGAADGVATSVSSLYATVSGTATSTELSQMVFLLNGPDATNVVGTYDSATGRITFSGLSLSVADASSEAYTIKAYYNDNTSSNDITEGHTVLLSVNASNFTTDSGGSTFAASQTSVTNGAGATIDVTATKLVYSQSPSTSVVSGSDFGTQPVLIAVDARGNIDRDFNGTVTLSENGSGSLTGTTSVTAVNGVATFTGVKYTSASDADANFTLTAAASALTSATSASIDPDVVATRLIFSTQPVPTTIRDGESTSFTTVPVVQAVDANGMIDQDYNGNIVLSVTDPNDGTVDGTVNTLSVTSGDQDASATTVTLVASGGVASFSGLAIQYTNTGSSNTLALRATSGSLTAINSASFTSNSNSAPVFTNLNGGATYTENGTAVVIDSDVTVADTELDALNSGLGNYNGASITIVRNGGASSSDLFGNSGLLGSLVQGQSFSYNGTAVGTVTSNSAGTLTLTFNSSATSAVVDAVLQSITYSNSSDSPPASVTLNWTFSDGSLNSSGSNQAVLAITPVNDAPVIGNTSVSKTFNEDTAQTFSAADFGFTDVDSGDTLQSITIVTAPSAGQLFIDANGDGVLGAGDILLGNGAVVSAANISKLTFRPAENANGAGYASFTWTVSDGTASSANTGTMTLNVTPVNDAPVIEYTSVNKYFNEDTSVTFSTLDFSFTDVDSGDTLQSITIVTAPTAGQLFIDADGDGVYGSGDTLIGNGAVVSVANISKLTFRPAENANGTGYASFTWKVSDGTANSANTGTMTFNVNPVNDAPVISNTAVSKTFDEDTAQSFTQADFGFTDVDSGDTLQSITIVTAPTAGQLFIDADGDGVYGSGDTLIANGSVVSAANISKLTFRPAENANGSGYASFTWKVSDGSVNSANTGTMTLNVSPVNDAPTISDTDVTKSVAVDSALGFTSADFGFSDVDSGDTLQYITIITAPMQGQLFLDMDNDGSYNPLLDLQLSNGSVVPSALISMLKYQPDSSGQGSVSFTWKVSDGQANSADTGTMTINVTGLNNAPTISTPAVTKTVNEDTALTFSSADFGFSDVDSGDTLQSITIVTAPAAGQLFIDANGDGVFGSGDTLLGNGAVVSAANISKLTFRPADNANGAGYASFSWTVSDGTLSSANTGTMTLNVTAVNDAPVIGNTAVSKTFDEDTAQTFTAADFGFTDIDSGDTLQSITIVTAPTAGQLFIDANGDGVFGAGDTLLGNGAVVSAANISKLTFRPAENANGAGYASFSWTVSDGNASSANTGIMTLNVTAVNDAPVAGALANQAATAGSSFSLQLANNAFTDVDGDTLTLSATLANGAALPAWLIFDPATGTFSGTPAKGDIGTLSIRVTATDSHQASASATFSLSVTRSVPNEQNQQNGGDPEFRINDGRSPSPFGQNTIRLNVAPAAPVTLGALFAPASLGALNSGGAPDATVTASLFQAARNSAPAGNAQASQLAGVFSHGAAEGGATQFDSALGSFPSFNNSGALGGSSSLSGVFSGTHLPSISVMEVFSGGSWRDITTSGDDSGESALHFNPGLQWQLQQSGEEELQRLAAIEQALNEMDQRQG